MLDALREARQCGLTATNRWSTTPMGDERDKAYQGSLILGGGIDSNVYRVPELRMEDREGYPFALPVHLPPVSLSNSTLEDKPQ